MSNPNFQAGDKVVFINNKNEGEYGTFPGLKGIAISVALEDGDWFVKVNAEDGKEYETYAHRWAKVHEEVVAPVEQDEVTQAGLEGAELANLIVQARDLKASIEASQQSYSIIVESIQTLAGKYGLKFDDTKEEPKPEVEPVTFEQMHKEGKVVVGTKVSYRGTVYTVEKFDEEDDDQPYKFNRFVQGLGEWPEAHYFASFDLVE